MAVPIRVLIVEDAPDDAELLAAELSRSGFEVSWQRVESEAQFLGALDPAPDVILADYSVPSFGALPALRLLRARGIDTPFIVVTGSLEDHSVLECLKEGASDYLLKDRLARLGSAVAGALKHVREAREKAQLEEQLRHAQRLESVGRLAGGIAHDFNNLLTVILGNAEIALAALHPSDPAATELAEIRHAAERAAGLTRQLLAFSRKQILEPRVFELDDVVRSMTSMLRRLIGEDIDLVMHLDGQGGRVLADPGQVEQVVVNLAVNARDAMPRGGKLTIETAVVDLDAAYARGHVAVEPGSYLMLAMTDSGVGMDAATRARIFEPFFTTKAAGKGTGLGLATVYGIVKQSGGSVWVYSEPGQGTTFKIYLPRVEQDLAPAPALRPGTLARASETVLLAEDEASVRALVGRVLRRHGYTVVEASNGGEALEAAARHAGPIHLLVSDVVMPGMNGRELFERLRATRAELRVLYLSGYTANAVVHHGVLEHGTALLQKPFTSDGLLRRVREVLDEG